MNPRPEVITEREELALRLFIHGYGFPEDVSEDRRLEEFYGRGDDQIKFWRGLAQIAIEYAAEKIEPLRLAGDDVERRPPAPFADVDGAKQIAELERAIVNLALLIGTGTAGSRRVPHLGRVK